MLDERPGPTEEQLTELGLNAEDLEHFEPPSGSVDDLGDQESTLEQSPAPDADHPPIPADAGQSTDPSRPADPAAESPTPGAQGEEPRSPSGARTEEPGQPAAAARTSPTPAPTTAPKQPDPTETPWTPAADGRRLLLEGAVVDREGNVRIPAKVLPQLQHYLADRSVWQEERGRLIEEIEARDPQRSRQVILSQLIADEMEAAAKVSDEALWDWVQGFREAIPRLREKADTEATRAENARLRARTDREDHAAQEARDEPVLQQGVTEYLDRYLALPQFAGLKGERTRLASRLWSMRDQLIGTADRDMPEAGLVRGQRYVKLDLVENELAYSAELLGQKQEGERQAAEREAAAKRNAAARGNPNIPPTVGVAGSPLPDAASSAARPKSREDYHDRMTAIAEGRVPI